MSRDGGDRLGRRPGDVLRRFGGAVRRDDGRPIFVDGLFLGAMVGAAIAGSTLWSRWRGGRARRPGGAPPSSPRDDGERPS